MGVMYLLDPEGMLKLLELVRTGYPILTFGDPKITTLVIFLFSSFFTDAVQTQ